jgi:putative two-component system response regulator
MYKMQQELEIYNKKLYKIINDQIRKIYEEQKNLVYALSKVCIARDHTIATHLERVGKNSSLLAMSLQLSSKYRERITNSFVDTIELAAYLHDIGKIAICDTAVFHKEELSAEENDLVKTHTTIGGEILQEITSVNDNNDFIKMAIDIAIYHHEKWDGSGYPMGISGSEIPLSARIVSIVDKFDLMINSQTDRPSFTIEMSLDIINSGSGIQYDPDIVAVFNKIQGQIKK